MIRGSVSDTGTSLPDSGRKSRTSRPSVLRPAAAKAYGPSHLGHFPQWRCRDGPRPWRARPTRAALSARPDSTIQLANDVAAHAPVSPSESGSWSSHRSGGDARRSAARRTRQRARSTPRAAHRRFWQRARTLAAAVASAAFELADCCIEQSTFSILRHRREKRRLLGRPRRGPKFSEVRLCRANSSSSPASACLPRRMPAIRWTRRACPTAASSRACAAASGDALD